MPGKRLQDNIERLQHELERLHARLDQELNEEARLTSGVEEVLREHRASRNPVAAELKLRRLRRIRTALQEITVCKGRLDALITHHRQELEHARRELEHASFIERHNADPDNPRVPDVARITDEKLDDARTLVTAEAGRFPPPSVSFRDRVRRRPVAAALTGLALLIGAVAWGMLAWSPPGPAAADIASRTGPRTAVEIAVVSLARLEGDAHVKALRDLRPALPVGLRAAELTRLLGPLGGPRRLEAVRLLIAHLRPASLPAQRLGAIAGPVDAATRARLFELLAPFAHGPLSPTAAENWLEPLAGRDRLRALTALAPMLPPLTADDAQRLLHGLDDAQRLQAAKLWAAQP